ncbi:alpha-actinin-1-like [Halichondria panicea]|uniref:alpha-actinin-1-like n=1 Tax=Halichondria panicea TaxID=6063 RepID=UPI00312BB5E8
MAEEGTAELGTAYEGAKDDINDKLVLDLAWERQQKKTFTAWCNSHLRKVGVKINELDQDFRDGSSLLRLLELISGDKVPPAEKRGKMRVHKIANVNKALKFISEHGVKLAGIGAEEIVDGNLKMTLGMIWTIILRFAIQDISVEELSAKEGLLLWCQRKTAPYKNVNVNNFHISFKDGLAFCALIHRHRPDLIDYDSLKKGNDMDNLNLAFEVAEKHLDIPKMLDAEDIVATPKPDERAIMTYVSSYYHAFSSSAQAEQAAKRIGQVLDVNKENEKMMEDYEQMATTLLEWIASTMPWVEDRTPETTLPETQSRLEEFRQYSTVTKPPKAQEKGELETHFHTLQTKLRLSNRPAYVPSEGKLVSDVNTSWKNLEAGEKQKQEFLMSELHRLQRLEHLAAKFEHKVGNTEKWADGKDEKLSRNDDIESANLAEILALDKIHDTFESDLEAANSRITLLETIAAELRDLNYVNSENVDARLQGVRDTFTNLKQMSDDRKARIQEAIASQQNLDSIRLDYAKRAATFNNWMDNTLDDLAETEVCSSITDVEALQAKHEEFKTGDLQEANVKYDELNGLVTTMAEMGSSENPYTALSPQAVYDKWCSVLDAVPQYEANLNVELEKQQGNEELRVAFAEKANVVGAYIEERSTALAELSMEGKGTMEEQLEAMKAFQEETVAYQPEIDAAESANQALENAIVFDNPHTQYSMDSIRSSWALLMAAINRATNETQNQILIRDSKGLSEAQLQEYRQSFNHFDKDKSGQLDKNEFRACLLSLGYKLGNDPMADPVYDKIWGDIDPNETGYVSFEAFVQFMSKEMVDEDSADQVMASFKILAGEKAYITADELRRELPGEQAEYCIVRMAPYTGPDAPEGALDYMSFSTALYGQSEL